MKRIIPLVISLFFIQVSITSAQDRAKSPSGKVIQTVGLTEITVEYSRPSVKDRTIFSADGLQAYGEMWRTGANSATKISFSDDVKLGGKELAAGEYTIISIPGAEEWTVNLYPYKESRWYGYREATPTVSLKVEPETLGSSVESFLIDINDLRDYSATMYLVWEKTAVPILIEVK